MTQEFPDRPSGQAADYAASLRAFDDAGEEIKSLRRDIWAQPAGVPGIDRRIPPIFANELAPTDPIVANEARAILPNPSGFFLSRLHEQDRPGVGFIVQKVHTLGEEQGRGVTFVNLRDLGEERDPQEIGFGPLKDEPPQSS